MNGYINYCAIKIQKVFRGHQLRKKVVDNQKVKRKLGFKNMKKLEGVALGFIVRKIMKLKEAKNRIQFVRDHDQRQFRETFEDRVLMLDSRKTACRQLIHFVRSL